MDLERLSVRLRPRKPWEAVDLGFAMVRTWGRSVTVPWLVLTIPVAALLTWSLTFRGLLLFWWLLPLFEAVVLFPLSRAVFGDLPPPRETLGAAPREMRRAWREVLLRRLHPARSFALPIGQLEDLSGAERRRRRAALGRAIDAHGSVTFVVLAIQLLLFCAAIALAMLMTPSWLGIDWDLALEGFFDGSAPHWAYALACSLWAGVVIALGPFYVAAGFALYLDRRTALEGWDLDIAFRRLARRLEAMHPARAATSPRRSTGPAARLPAILAAGLLAGLVAAPGPPVHAQEAEPTRSGAPAAEPPPEMIRPPDWHGAPDDDPRRVARRILGEPDFGGYVDVERWQLRQDLADWLEGKAPEESRESRPSPLLLALAWTIQLAVEIGLWILLGVVLLLLVVVTIRRWPDAGRSTDEGPAPPDTLFGLDLRAESLPADVAAEAERLWRSGDRTGALGLLYRGALARLTEEGVALAGSFTEDDCLRAARRTLPPLRTGFFAELTRAWQRVAYGHRVPDSAEGERWCDGYRRHFGPNAGALPGDPA